MHRFRAQVTALATALALTGPVISAPTHAAAPADIVARLKAIPGMKVVDDHGDGSGYRSISLTYRQPADHRHPGRGWFRQRIMLEHRSAERPMVLHTSGYTAADSPGLSEVTELLDANQVTVEHRFFGSSRPRPADWSKDTVWQSAADDHRLIVALKAVYGAKWISTGASKGGMTAVYHRRFHPGDVDGTVAYVAPNDVDNAKDGAYDRFLQSRNHACRDRLRGLQGAFLRHRPAMVKKIRAAGGTFGIVRSADVAFEHAVMDFEWMFWQYDLLGSCKRLPDPRKASVRTLYATLDRVVGATSYDDASLRPSLPYYYEAGIQLGWPSMRFRHLKGLLRHAKSYYLPRTYVSRKIKMRFRKDAMRDIDSWVRGHGTRLMFVYGQNDPWSAEPFRLGAGSRDSAVYVAPGMNHGASIGDLRPKQRARATADLLRWAGVTAPPQRLPGETAADPLADTHPRL
ncbi:S28 family serine protease [Actinocorallia longicatena]|uniref:S28 family serine protease n=1 Tax=Actinocorallia longicatena TaxID=111803 RepID=A0ABP6QBL9_9ACTN